MSDKPRPKPCPWCGRDEQFTEPYECDNLPISLPAAEREIARLKAKLGHFRSQWVASCAAEIRIRETKILWNGERLPMSHQRSMALAEARVAAAEKAWDDAAKEETK